MTLKTAASFVVSTLLGSPQAGEAFTPFAAHEVRMVSSTMPSHSMSRGAMKIPTSGSTSGAGTARVARDQKRSASSSTTPSHFSGDSEDVFGDNIDTHHPEEDEQHPASTFYFADEGITKSPPAQQHPSTPAQRDQLPLPAPPEPGKGGEAFQSAYNRPWRKRARDARSGTVFENKQGLGSVGLGEGGSSSRDAMRQRASEKEEVVASRKKTQKNAMNSAVLPIVDLVGIVSPLVIIVGMTVVQHVLE